MKQRLFDFTVGSMLWIVSLPILAVAGLAIYVTDGGPVVFRQTRIGQGGRPFTLYKLRSMRIDAGTARAVTVAGDRRITAVGRWLRRTKVDELPQLYNVIRGDMALVGPRPEVEEFVEHYTTSQRAVLNVKPGITDPASLKFFDEEHLLSSKRDPIVFYVNELMPEKIRINLDYAARRSVVTDCALIVRTLFRVAGVASRPAPNSDSCPRS